MLKHLYIFLRQIIQINQMDDKFEALIDYRFSVIDLLQCMLCPESVYIVHGVMLTVSCSDYSYTYRNFHTEQSRCVVDLCWRLYYCDMSNLTAEQRQTIEAVQRRACQISVGSGTYVENCTRLGLEKLAERRHYQAPAACK